MRQNDMKNETRDECICGVNCTASNCKYHTTGDCCCANSINVKNENAVVKGETFCGTFTPRSSM